MLSDDMLKALKDAHLVEVDDIGEVNKLTAMGEMLLIMYGIAIANDVIKQMFRNWNMR
jgi:hypothetical protein